MRGRGEEGLRSSEAQNVKPCLRMLRQAGSSKEAQNVKRSKGSQGIKCNCFQANNLLSPHRQISSPFGQKGQSRSRDGVIVCVAFYLNSIF